MKEHRTRPKQFGCAAARPTIGVQDSGEVGVGNGRCSLHDAARRSARSREMRQRAARKACDGDFVGGVEHGGQRAAVVAGCAGEIERGEIGGARRFEIPAWPSLAKSSGRQAVRHAVRPGHGVLDREAHVAVD